jgi:hypothetical protein
LNLAQMIVLPDYLTVSPKSGDQFGQVRFGSNADISAYPPRDVRFAPKTGAQRVHARRADRSPSFKPMVDVACPLV